MKFGDRNGVLGLEVVKDVVFDFLILAVVGIAVILALVSLQNANIFTAGSVAANQTNSIVGNVSGGLSTFFGSAGTIFSILVVVVIILAIAIIIYAVGKFGHGGEMAGAGEVAL